MSDYDSHFQKTHGPTQGWFESSDGKRVLADVYVRGLLDTAIEFEEQATLGSKDPLGDCEEKAGKIVIEAYDNGFLRNIPGLDELVKWHTGDGSDDPVPGDGRHCVYTRCPYNLFWEVIGGNSFLMLSDGGLGINTKDGILPQLSQTIFGNPVPPPLNWDSPESQAQAKQERRLKQSSIKAEACRFLANSIKTLPDGPYGSEPTDDGHANAGSMSPHDEKLAKRNEWFYFRRLDGDKWETIRIAQVSEIRCKGCAVGTIRGVQQAARKHAEKIGKPLPKGKGGRPKQQ